MKIFPSMEYNVIQSISIEGKYFTKKIKKHFKACLVF
jgi:hypothetical protein